MTWISVKERLPSFEPRSVANGMMVLAASEGLYNAWSWNVVLCVISEGGVKWVSGYQDGKSIEHNVIYWMKIPALPGFENEVD